MQKIITLVICSLLVAIIVSPNVAYAHQPRIATENPITVTDPEVSKAYYGTLSGAPVVYRIAAEKPFALYVNVLVPDIAGQKKDVSALILKDGKQVASLDGTNFEWKQFFEEFGHDTYWEGPAYKAQVGAGNYEIRVSSSNNDSKYSLAIGETEAFDFREGTNALTLIPQIKRNFFNESPANFILSPFGFGLIIIMFALAFMCGFLFRLIFKTFAKNSVHGAGRNIGANDRYIRLAIGIVLFAWAITTSWSPILLFFAGFALFEIIFSWSVIYAALGKNTRPVK
ncbi:MAG: DUF2892 domain-containing protein [Microcoleus sp.]